MQQQLLLVWQQFSGIFFKFISLNWTKLAIEMTMTTFICWISNGKMLNERIKCLRERQHEPADIRGKRSTTIVYVFFSFANARPIALFYTSFQNLSTGQTIAFDWKGTMLRRLLHDLTESNINVMIDFISLFRMFQRCDPLFNFFWLSVYFTKNRLNSTSHIWQYETVTCRQCGDHRMFANKIKRSFVQYELTYL